MLKLLIYSHCYCGENNEDFRKFTKRYINDINGVEWMVTRYLLAETRGEMQDLIDGNLSQIGGNMSGGNLVLVHFNYIVQTFP